MIFEENEIWIVCEEVIPKFHDASINIYACFMQGSSIMQLRNICDSSDDFNIAK